jgi:hypothetical protein
LAATAVLEATAVTAVSEALLTAASAASAVQVGQEALVETAAKEAPR